MATEGKKQKAVSALYEDRAPAGKKKVSARARASSEEEEENPCIASLRRHNPPPRPLPPGVAAAGGATGREKSSSSRQASTPEEDIDDGEEENPENEKEDEEYIYAPEQNDEDDDNSYDHDDDMSEEGAFGEEKQSIDISSGEDEARVKGNKRRKKKTSVPENSVAWTHFEKIFVVDEENPEGPKVLKARCLHCTKDYAYVQGSSTTTLNRHWKGKCKKLNSLRYAVLAKMAMRFLTIPASSVSSESTFSTGGRVLDDYRSSLKPVMVEALVCGASYIKGSHNDLNVLEEVDEEENVEIIKLPKAALNNNY